MAPHQGAEPHGHQGGPGHVQEQDAFQMPAEGQAEIIEENPAAAITLVS